uniref:Large ribosomal subunit protein eL20 n=1 Tax=Naja naja TaxID=35670 RepID=A0A8C6VBI7_NAJNA
MRSSDETLREYKNVVRCLLSPRCPTSSFYGVHIFAPNYVVLRSSEETVHCEQVYENSPLKMKNFDIRLPWDSHSGTHSMNKECQDLTTVGDATQCYHDMRTHHRTYTHSFQIMKVGRDVCFFTKRPNTFF